jgi:hypothetical protein
MVRTTRAQREALFRIFQRDFPTWVSPGKRRSRTSYEIEPVATIQWRKFRKTVEPYVGDDTCVMVPRWGMWIGVESNGYTHT